MKVERLGNIVKIQKGKKQLFSDNKESKSVRFIQIDDLRNDNNLKFTDDTNGILAKKEDVLIAWDGANAGTIGFGKEGFIGSTIALLRIVDKNKYSHNFIGYLLRSKSKELKGISKSATIPHINRGALANIKVPLIPLTEQRKIAYILSKAEALIQKRKETLKDLDQLLKSTFLEMFGDPVQNPKGWEKETIRNVSKIFKDGPFGSNLKSEHYKEYGIRVIRLQNIGVGQFIDKDKVFISEEHFENVLKKYACISGDVIIGTMGEPNIRACILPTHIELAVNKADCIQCRPNKDIVLPEYISCLLNSPNAINMIGNILHGQTRVRISMGQLAELKIPIPPLKLQTQFAEKVAKLEALKAKQTVSLRELEQLYQSLMQRAFRGELDLGKIQVEDLEKQAAMRQEAEKGLHSKYDGGGGEEEEEYEPEKEEEVISIKIKTNDKEAIKTLILNEYRQSRGVFFDGLLEFCTQKTEWKYDDLKAFVFEELSSNGGLFEQEYNENAQRLFLVLKR